PDAPPPRHSHRRSLHYRRIPEHRGSGPAAADGLVRPSQQVASPGDPVPDIGISSAARRGDPIPGIDITVNQSPGGASARGETGGFCPGSGGWCDLTVTALGNGSVSVEAGLHGGGGGAGKVKFDYAIRQSPAIVDLILPDAPVHVPDTFSVSARLVDPMGSPLVCELADVDPGCDLGLALQDAAGSQYPAADTDPASGLFLWQVASEDLGAGVHSLAIRTISTSGAALQEGADVTFEMEVRPIRIEG
ncbi:MAG: hypothetical protein RRA92_10735, partial [Gemmatimonadota bacterium]|nr:hypothetical protein [Gemmatimonadota bacterium]